MIIKVSAKRQITIPARVLTALGTRPGDFLELREHPDGFILCRRRIDTTRLAPLRKQLRKGKGRFDLESSRLRSRDPSLRD